LFEALGLQQAMRDVIGDDAIELFHRHSQPVSPWRVLVEPVQYRYCPLLPMRRVNTATNAVLR
jgi:hypothetical protein